MVLSRKPPENLNAEQSNWTLRLARVVAAAEATFGSTEKADVWMRRRTFALDGECALHLLDTDAGARKVIELLGRIEHGLSA